MSVSVKVEGLNRTIRNLTKMGVDISDLKTVFHKIGLVVVNEGRQNVNTRTGKLAKSIRASKGRKNQAVVRAGTKRVPYAAAIHWGVGPRKGKLGPHNINAQQYLTRAAVEKRPQVVQMLEDGIENVIHKLGLQD